jgi:hypothetical protein
MSTPRTNVDDAGRLARVKAAAPASPATCGSPDWPGDHCEIPSPARRQHSSAIA